MLINPYHLWLLKFTCLAATDQPAVLGELLRREEGILYFLVTFQIFCYCFKIKRIKVRKLSCEDEIVFGAGSFVLLRNSIRRRNPFRLLLS